MVERRKNRNNFSSALLGVVTHFAVDFPSTQNISIWMISSLHHCIIVYSVEVYSKPQMLITKFIKRGAPSFRSYDWYSDKKFFCFFFETISDGVIFSKGIILESNLTGKPIESRMNSSHNSDFWSMCTKGSRNTLIMTALPYLLLW